MFNLITNLETQLSRLPYYFDDQSRWGLVSKKDMQKQGITSPDIADTLAFAQMEGISYAPVKSHETVGTEQDKEQWDELNELAAML